MKRDDVLRPPIPQATVRPCTWKDQPWTYWKIHLLYDEIGPVGSRLSFTKDSRLCIWKEGEFCFGTVVERRFKHKPLITICECDNGRWCPYARKYVWRDVAIQRSWDERDPVTQTPVRLTPPATR